MSIVLNFHPKSPPSIELRLTTFSVTSYYTAARSMVKVSALSMKVEFPKALFGLAPALIASPAFASVDVRLRRVQ
jgi:hypothetical protein